MAGGQDDAAVRAGEDDGQFGRRGRSETALHNIHAAGDEGAADELLDHRTADARVASDDHFVAFSAVGNGPPLLQAGAVGIGEFDDIDGRERFAGGSADRSADAGDGFYQCHGLQN